MALVPVPHRNLEGKSTVSLVSLDYSPMPSKSKLFQSEYKNEPDSWTMESLRNMASYFHQLGQIGLMDDTGTSSIGYKTSSTVTGDVVFSNLMNASKEETARGGWGMVNYLLGVIAFIMFAYLIKTMQKRAPAGGKGGGFPGAAGRWGSRGGRGGGLGARGGRGGRMGMGMGAGAGRRK